MILSSYEATAHTSLKVTLGGHVDTQIGYINQKLDTKDPSVSGSLKMRSFNVVNDTNIDIRAEAKTNDYIYGAHIRLNADVSADTSGDSDVIADRTYVFVKNGSYGELQMGATKSTSAVMQTSANNIARGAGGIGGYTPKWLNGKTGNGNSFVERFIKWSDLPTNCDCISYANKWAYYSPVIKGWKLGASYTPDIKIHGTVNRAKRFSKFSDGDFKNIFDLGAYYENNYKNFGYRIGATSQHGDAKNNKTPRKDLNAYEVGAILSYGDFSVAGSYSDWNKSGVPVTRDPNKKYGAFYYTLGASYIWKDFGSSITYFKGKRANVYTFTPPASTADHDISHNSNEYIVFGLDYKYAAGITNYVDYLIFDTKYSGGVPSNKGGVVIFGTAINF